jgi:DNA invertase Pin-like site-specific DNA recombinase
MSPATNGAPLRAVGYCRTSSTRQKDNSSIPIQRDAIAAFSARQGWDLVAVYTDEAKSGAKVTGRGDYQRMLADARAGRFDVIIPFDLTRLGRDGLDILGAARDLGRECGVRITDTKGSFDSGDRQRTLTNFVMAGVSEHERLAILSRTKLGKIARAKPPLRDDPEHGHERGYNGPASRARPFGRLWDARTKRWSIDPDKQALVRAAAERYLAGVKRDELAPGCGIRGSHLVELLRAKCGGLWPQRITCPELGLDEVVMTRVPALLSDDTIAAIAARAEFNRTFERGEQSRGYLLARCVFCATCGYGLGGARGSRREGYRVYRHNPHTMRLHPCPEPPGPVPADALEATVLRHLFAVFGNPSALERAALAAQPAAEQRSAVLVESERLAGAIATIDAKLLRLAEACAEGTLPRDVIQAQADKLDGQKQALQGQAAELARQLRDLRDPAEVRGRARRYADALRGREGRFAGMSAADRRALVTLVFAGRMPDGSKLGVSVGRVPDAPGRFTYRIQGHLCEGRGWFPSWAAETVVDEHGAMSFAEDMGEAFAEEDRTRAGPDAAAKLRRAARKATPC